MRRHPPSWNSQREKQGTLPNLTGWKLKTTGISVTSSVMQFDYQDKRINILTPQGMRISQRIRIGPTTVDSAVMVIDSAKGIEAQTKNFSKLLKRGIPFLLY